MAKAGYNVSIRGFVEVDPDDFEALGNAVAAFKEAKAGNLGPLSAVMAVEDFTIRSVARRTKAEGEGEAAKEPEVPVAAAPAKAA